MDELTLKTFCIGGLSTNCYLIYNKISKKGFVVDSPVPFDEVLNFIKVKDLDIKFIALTHGHFDHIGSLDFHDIEFYIHSKELDFLITPQLNNPAFFNQPLKIGKKPKVYDEEKPLFFEGLEIKVIPTPGHTPGSVSLKIGNWLFSGDSLFFNSIGRTDIPFASEDVLRDSIKNNLFILSDETVVYPGHGPSTTIKREKELNPFL